MSKVDTMELEEPQRACAPFVHSTGLSQHERDIHVRLLSILPINIPPSGIIVGEHSCSLRGSPVRYKSQPAVRDET